MTVMLALQTPSAIPSSRPPKPGPMETSVPCPWKGGSSKWMCTAGNRGSTKKLINKLSRVSAVHHFLLAVQR